MIGTRIGNYEIVGQAGHGGMGVVYEARHLQLGSRAAIKAILSRDGSPTTTEHRLKQEAQMAASVDHPYVCRVYDLAEHDSQLYIVMEYVTGETLSTHLLDGSLSREDKLRVTAELTEALAAIHEAGLIHGDLKPSNVMVGRDGHVKVMDFGLARRAEAAISREITRSRTSTETNRPPGGTLPYMAPELMHGTAPSARSDMWALGVVAHEIWTGEHPFIGPTLASTAARVIGPEPTEARLQTAFAKHPWQRSLGACLTRESQRRPATAVDLLRDVTDEPKKDSAHRRPLVVSAALFLVVASVTAWYLLGGSAPPERRVAMVPVGEGSSLTESRTLAVLASAYLSEFERSQVIPFDRIRPLLAQMDLEQRNDLPALRAALGVGTLVGVDVQPDTLPMVGVFRVLRGGRPEQSFTQHGSTIPSLARQASVELASLLEVDGGEEEPSVYTEFPDAIRHYDQAQGLQADLRYSDAIEALDTAIDIDPDFLAARILRAQIHATIGLTDSAKVEVAEVREAMQQRNFSPTGRWHRYTSALHARYTKSPEMALVEVQSLCDADPTDLVACPILIDVLDTLGRYEEVFTLTDRLLAEYPMDLELRLGRISTLAELGRYAGAFEDADRLEEAARLLSLNSLGGFISEQRGYVSFRSGDYETALAHYQHARDRYVRDGLELLALGPLKSTADANIKLWRFDDASEALERALPLARSSGNLGLEARILNSLGALAYRQRRLDEAVRRYTESDEVAERLGSFRLRRSANLNAVSSYILLGDLDHARRQLKLTRDLWKHHRGDPPGVAILLREADLARAEGRFDDAIEMLIEDEERFVDPQEELSFRQRLLQAMIDSGSDRGPAEARRAVEVARELGTDSRLMYTLDLAVVVAARHGEPAEELAAESAELYDRSSRAEILTLTHEWAILERQAAEQRWTDMNLEFAPATPGRESMEIRLIKIRALRRLGRFDEAQSAADDLLQRPWLTEFEKSWLRERLAAAG